MRPEPRRRGGAGELVTGRKRTVPTFEEAVERVIAVHRAGWKDDGRQEKLWRASLRDHAMPKLGGRPVQPDQHGGRDGGAAPDLERQTGDGAPRPAADRGGDALGGGAGLSGGQPRWRDHRRALPKNGFRPQHHRALPYAEVGETIQTVRASGAYAATALAFEFLVLTACRSGEVRGALWKEIDIEGREWRIPAERMKTGREHRVPLSGRSLAVLQEARRLADGSGFVFPSARGPATLRGGHATMGPQARDRRGASRVPFELPGLGGGVFGRATRSLRIGAGPREHERHRGSLSAHGPVRAAAGAHGAVERVPGRVKEAVSPSQG